MTLAVAVRRRGAGLHGAHHGAAHVIIPQRVQEGNALRKGVGHIERHVPLAAVVVAELLSGRRVTPLQDADEVVALDSASEAQRGGRRVALDTRRLTPGSVVVSLGLRHGFVEVLHAVGDRHDVADADHVLVGRTG